MTSSTFWYWVPPLSQRSASVWVNILDLWPAIILGLNMLCMFCMFDESPIMSKISLSLSIPSARNNVKIGTSWLICLTLTYTVLSLRDTYSQNVFGNTEFFSDVHLMNASYEFARLASLHLLTYRRFVTLRSWATMTFSLPSIIKYPPWSYGHSPAAFNMLVGWLFNMQILECNMIGMWQRNTLSIVLTSVLSCSWSINSTTILALNSHTYDLFFMRHSFG